jgi:hypothetical protein
MAILRTVNTVRQETATRDEASQHFWKMPVADVGASIPRALAGYKSIDRCRPFAEPTCLVGVGRSLSVNPRRELQSASAA